MTDSTNTTFYEFVNFEARYPSRVSFRNCFLDLRDPLEFIELLPSNSISTFARSAGHDHDGYSELKDERKSRFTVQPQ